MSGVFGPSTWEGPAEAGPSDSEPVSRILSRADIYLVWAEALTERFRTLRPTWTSPSRVDGPAWPCTGRGLPGRRVTTTPVRSYRTISPLPVRGSRVAAPSAVCFCGTFPRLSPGGRYPPPCPLVSGLSSRRISLRPASARLAPAMLERGRHAATRRTGQTQTLRKTPTTLPRTLASVVMIGSISSFSGWRRM